MAKEEPIELEGQVVKAEKGSFVVQLCDGQGEPLLHEGKPHTVIATLGGKMRQNYIRVVPGDKVRLELSPYDTTRGRITFRHR